MSKLELVTLDSIPTQIGTEFCIISQDITFCLNNFVVINKNRLKHLDCRVDIDYSSINICDNMVIMAKPHAELRALYKETGEEFDCWEITYRGDNWSYLTEEPNWLACNTYRYNPNQVGRTITINGIEVPAPETEEPDYKDIYYVVNTFRSCEAPIKYCWECSGIEKLWLKRGLIHRSNENAQKHLNALILASGGTIEN